MNGKDIGLMNVEEHYSKELPESQGRKNGVIVRFDESLIWESLRLNKSGTIGVISNPPFDRYSTSTIKPFQASKVAKDAKLSSDMRTAAGLLRRF